MVRTAVGTLPMGVVSLLVVSGMVGILGGPDPHVIRVRSWWIEALFSLGRGSGKGSVRGDLWNGAYSILHWRRAAGVNSSRLGCGVGGAVRNGRCPQDEEARIPRP